MKVFGGVKFVYALLIATLVLGAFGASSVKAAEETGTIVDVALAANAETGEFSILIAALQAANPSVINRLSSEKQSTVFAPTDAAFLALLDELGVTAEQLLSNRHLVTKVLRYHIVRGNLDSTEVLAKEHLRNLRGGRISQSNGVLTDANGRTANIIQTDIQASNGVIHVIDRVLLPKIGGITEPEIENSIVDVALAANEETGEFSILIAALEAADPVVLQTLSGKRQFTVFAPTDAAFASLLAELGVTQEQLLADQALLTQVLLYHVAPGNRDSEDVLESKRIRTLQGGRLSQENGVLTDASCRAANIIQVDIQASNGVIHVIDRVVLPPSNPQSDDEDRARICNSIVDVAKAANAQSGEFSILISALQAADPGIIEKLSSKGQYTVFAPTDAAFQALLEELGVTAEQLLSDQALVTKVLRYHIARGNLDSTKVLARERIRTLQGRISQENGVLTDFNGRTVNIIQTDIQASNGVIHVIDRVLLPDLTPDSDDDD